MRIKQPVAPEPVWRERCYGCHRPVERCFCHLIPKIQNRTEVVILQHMRERFHPFNTARILRRSLLRSQLLVDHIGPLASSFSRLQLSSDVGLLYPGQGGMLLEELSPAQRPKQLIVLDGTWHHTKTLLREIPQLQRLPRVSLVPTEPSRYDLRREPHLDFVCTLEATVAALRCLEPDTEGFEALLAAFDAMVATQMAHPRTADSSRRNVRRRKSPTIVPPALRSSLEKVVVVYGETTPTGNRPRERSNSIDEEPPKAPVYWVAQRLSTNELFESAIAPARILPGNFYQHLELPVGIFDGSPSMDLFRERWNAFVRPGDSIVYYYPNTKQLLDYIGVGTNETVYLKRVQLHPGRKNGLIEELLATLGVPVPTAVAKGRAGKRLSYCVALCHHLSALVL